jgi:glutaminase
MVTCGMYHAAGDWVSAVGMPAKSGVGGGIVAVLPGQLGIGVYSPLLDDKGNSVRGVRVCRSLSERLGLHFLTVTRESRSTIRTISDACDRVRVYELHGDLLFAGAEQVLRRVEREKVAFDWRPRLTRVDTINTPPAACSRHAGDAVISGRRLLVDPDNAGAGRKPGRIRALVFGALDDAVAAAKLKLGSRPGVQLGGFVVPAQCHGVADSPVGRSGPRGSSHAPGRGAAGT